MNNFTPKYIKMASQYLQESLENLQQKEKVDKIEMKPIEKKNFVFKNLVNWMFKN